MNSVSSTLLTHCGFTTLYFQTNNCLPFTVIIFTHILFKEWSFFRGHNIMEPGNKSLEFDQLHTILLWSCFCHFKSDVFLTSSGLKKHVSAQRKAAWQCVCVSACIDQRWFSYATYEARLFWRTSDFSFNHRQTDARAWTCTPTATGASTSSSAEPPPTTGLDQSDAT